jgi:membrane-bound metal-dependent hydrolase YbcI (DUF457 family)
MDPLMHVVLPVLLLLAIRVDTRMVLLLSPLAILPDFDAAFGLHRALFHSFIPIVVLPVALLCYARLRRPEWMLGAWLALFYLSSHVVLDLGGVAFLWPVVQDQFYFEPEVTFNLEGGVNFGFDLEYGMKPLEEMGTTSFLSGTGFAIIFLAVLLAAVFRKEALEAARRAWRMVVQSLARL